MKSLLKTSILLFLAFIVSFLAITTAAGQPTVGADLLYKSKYLWRGMPFDPEAVFWPDAWVSYQGVMFTLFGSMELTDITDNQYTFTNVVYYLDYTRTFGKVTGIVGYAHYTYPNTDSETTGEIYFGVSGDLKYCSASVRGYFDVIDAKGIYLNPILTRSIPIPNVATNLSLALGYGSKKHNAYYFPPADKAAFTDVTTTLKFAYTPPGCLGKLMSLGLDLNYAVIVDSKLKEAYDDDCNFCVGFSLNFSKALGGE